MNLESQVTDLRKNLNESGAVTFYRKDAVGRWQEAITVLETEGFAESELVEIDSQSSCLIVRKRGS